MTLFNFISYAVSDGRIIANSELIRMRTEAVVTCFILAQHWFGGTEKDYKITGQDF
jgi:hypothetical protein